MNWHVQLELSETDVQQLKAAAKDRNASTGRLLGAILSEVLRKNLVEELLQGVKLPPRYARGLEPEPVRGKARTLQQILSRRPGVPPARPQGPPAPPARPETPPALPARPETPPAPLAPLARPETPQVPLAPSQALPVSPAPLARPETPQAPLAPSQAPPVPPAPLARPETPPAPPAPPQVPQLRVVRPPPVSASEKRGSDFQALEKAIRYPGDYLDEDVAVLREQWQWGEFTSEDSKQLARAERARVETYGEWRSRVARLQRQLKNLEQALFKSSTKKHVVKRGQLRRQRAQVSRELTKFKREIRFEKRDLESTG